MAKDLVKAVISGVFFLAVLPSALLAGFGRWETIYGFFATSYSLVPGLPGDYLRICFYRLTLAECPLSSRIQFGSFFAHPSTRVKSGVYIGSYCIVGKVTIGENTQIASGVQILSGRHQHTRGPAGKITGSEEGVFEQINIGRDCWIGAGSIVMADVGAGSTIGAGSVVSRPIPAECVAAGVPAKVIKPSEPRP